MVLTTLPSNRKPKPLHLPARRGGRRQSRRVGTFKRLTTSPPRSPGRSAAEPPGGDIQAVDDFTSPLAGEVGGKAAGWGHPLNHLAWRRTTPHRKMPEMPTPETDRARYLRSNMSGTERRV